MSPSPPSITFVACVESGALEEEILRLAESLRKWGGAFKNCPFHAVTPRHGPPIQSSVLNRFADLEVTHHYCKHPYEYSWSGPFNKPLALTHVESIATTDLICWLDTDVLVVAEPTELLLETDIQFAAYPSSSTHGLGSTGTSHPQDNYWQKLLKLFEVSIEDYPMINTQPQEDGKMRMYWQSGVFVYRRETRLGQHQLECLIKILDHKIASKITSTYYNDQVALALAVHKLDLKFKELSRLYNYDINKLNLPVDTDNLADARVVHYFGSLWPDYFEKFCSFLKDTHSDVYDWLIEKGPLAPQRPFIFKFWSKLLTSYRNYQKKAYRQKCKYL